MSLQPHRLSAAASGALQVIAAELRELQVGSPAVAAEEVVASFHQAQHLHAVAAGALRQVRSVPLQVGAKQVDARRSPPLQREV